MAKPRICAVITSGNTAVVDNAAKYADLFELRIDMIGDGWEKIAGRLNKPWIACCRSRAEGGQWKSSEAKRIEILKSASELGAAMVDIELSSPGLEKTISPIKKSSACLISFHDLLKTPPIEELRDIVTRQIAVGASICKVVTTARSLEDNITVLSVIREFPGKEVIAFAMGAQGVISRILCPLVGGSFTYASTAAGEGSAPGQVPAADLREIYRMLKAK